jgi:hypothetical protein
VFGCSTASGSHLSTDPDSLHGRVRQVTSSCDLRTQRSPRVELIGLLCATSLELGHETCQKTWPQLSKIVRRSEWLSMIDVLSFGVTFVVLPCREFRHYSKYRIHAGNGSRQISLRKESRIVAWPRDYQQPHWQSGRGLMDSILEFN